MARPPGAAAGTRRSRQQAYAAAAPQLSQGAMDGIAAAAAAGNAKRAVTPVMEA
jgi:hypothetical protein